MVNNDRRLKRFISTKPWEALHPQRKANASLFGGGSIAASWWYPVSCRNVLREMYPPRFPLALPVRGDCAVRKELRYGSKVQGEHYSTKTVESRVSYVL